MKLSDRFSRVCFPTPHLELIPAYGTSHSSLCECGRLRRDNREVSVRQMCTGSVNWHLQMACTEGLQMESRACHCVLPRRQLGRGEASPKQEPGSCPYTSLGSQGASQHRAWLSVDGSFCAFAFSQEAASWREWLFQPAVSTEPGGPWLSLWSSLVESCLLLRGHVLLPRSNSEQPG